jgi:hypothetical protein
MPLIQKIDVPKFAQHRGSGMPYKTRNNHQIYLTHSQGQPSVDYLKQGEAFNFSSLIDGVKTVGNFISNNKDTIGSVASADGSVSNATKSISDTIKTSKDLEKIKQVQQIKQKAKPKSKDIELTNEQLEDLKKLGSGFVRVSN